MTWLDDIETRLASVQCSYVGRCNSSRCPMHGGETRALRRLLRVARAAEAVLAYIDRNAEFVPMRSQLVDQLRAALAGESR